MAGGLQTVGQNSILNYKQLTSAIKNATSADRLLQLAYTHQRCAGTGSHEQGVLRRPVAYCMVC